MKIKPYQTHVQLPRSVELFLRLEHSPLKDFSKIFFFIKDIHRTIGVRSSFQKTIISLLHLTHLLSVDATKFRLHLGIQSS